MQMSNCSVITAGVQANCANPIQGGADDRLILVNFDDWKASVFTLNANPQIIEDITLPEGKVGYEYEGLNGSVAPKSNLLKGKHINMYNHEVGFIVFDVSPATKVQLEKFNGGRFVAIVENNYKGTAGNSSFEVYGKDSGLVLEANERDLGNADTNGAYSLVLKVSERSPEPHLPASIYITSYNASKAVVDALLV